MPIRADQLHRYPPEFYEIAHWIKTVRAGGRCECLGECGRENTHLEPVDGRCRNRHGERTWGVGGVRPTLVILGTAHLDHTPEHIGQGNLRAFCPGCHLAHDQGHHSATRRAAITDIMVPLFELEDLPVV